MEFRPGDENMVGGPATGQAELLTAPNGPHKDVSPFQAEVNLAIDEPPRGYLRSWLLIGAEI